MSSLDEFLKKISNVTRRVNNITRTVSTVNSTVRSVQRLRDQLRGKDRTSRRTATAPGSSQSAPKTLIKPLGLTPVSKVSSGRNTNKRPVRPPSRTRNSP